MRRSSRIRSFATKEKEKSNMNNVGDCCNYEGKIEGRGLLEMEEEQEESDEEEMLGVSSDGGILVQEMDVDHMALLIQAVEERPILYASACRGNGGKGRAHNMTKEKAWQEVSYIVGREVVWCTRKWKSLRDTFVKKVNSLRGKNASVRRKIQSWTYFSSLTFLSDYIHHQSPATKNRMAQHREEIAYTKQQGLMPHLVTTDFLEIGIQEEKPRTMTPTSSNSNSNSMTRIINSLNGINQIQNSTTSISNKRERERDSFEDGPSQELWGREPCAVETATTTTTSGPGLDVHDYFCMSLAQQMRNFTSARSSEARMRISQIMFEIESRSD